MSGKQLTGTLEGTLDGLLDERAYSASLSLSGDLMIGEQAVPVMAQGNLSMSEGHVQPTRGVFLGNLVVIAQDSGENLAMRLAIHGNDGEFLSIVGDELFDGIEAGSFRFERGAASADGTLPIKMSFQHSATVETNQLTGQCSCVASTNGAHYSFGERVEIEMKTGDLLEKHDVLLEGEVSLGRSPEGTLKLQSNQGELGMSLIGGKLLGQGEFGFDWRQLWATGIFRGSKRGLLRLTASMNNIAESDVSLRLD